MTYIDVDELTLRIGEACMGNKRPSGVTAQEALKQLQEMTPEIANGFQRAALAAAQFIAECCNATTPGSVEVKVFTIPRSEGMVS